MKIVLTVSLLLISSFSFSQKTTLTVKKNKDSMPLENGLYSSDIYKVTLKYIPYNTQVSFNIKTLLLIDNNQITYVQKIIDDNKALKLHKKGKLFKENEFEIMAEQSYIDNVPCITYTHYKLKDIGVFLESDEKKEYETYELNITDGIKIPVFIFDKRKNITSYNPLFYSYHYSTFKKID